MNDSPVYDHPKQPKDAVLKILFDSRGRVQRVKLYVSSGYKSRDDLCIEYCQGLTHPPSKIGHKLAGDSWRNITIHKDAVFIRK